MDHLGKMIDKVAEAYIGNTGGNKMDLETMAQTFFKQDAATVARSLLGMEIVRQIDNGSELKGRITEVSAWEGTYGEHTKHKFDQYVPGTVSVSCKFGKYLVDVTCGEGRSCVTLIAGDVTSEGKTVTVNGPGNLSKALEIDPSFDGYVVNSTDALRIKGASAPASDVRQRNKGNVPPNCRGYFHLR